MLRSLHDHLNIVPTSAAAPTTELDRLGAMPTVSVEDTRVEVPATASLPPLLRLSALEVQWLAVPLIQRLFIFEDGGGGQLPPFASVVTSLRASLADTLARFPPLAGRIVFLPSTGEAAIDCASEGGGGARFVVAESSHDVAMLAGDVNHDVDAFKRLVPVLDAAALPAEAMAVQVTRLQGGLAVGVAMHHAVVDGRSLWRFVEAWAAACRGDAADLDRALPTFDRAVRALPGGEELARTTLRKYNLDLPAVTQFPIDPNIPRRTFSVAAKHIRRLKQRIADLTNSPQPSSFVAIAAVAWVSFVRSKHPATISEDHDVYLFFFVDCRGRRGMEPPVSEDYFGTCITGSLAKATARDLLAEDDGAAVAAAAVAVQEEVRRAAEDPLALWDWMSLVSAAWLPRDRMVNMSGSTRFPAYEMADFGWGAPRRTELVTMNHDGQVVLLAARGGGGGVQASVAIHPDHVDAFGSHFVSCLD